MATATADARQAVVAAAMVVEDTGGTNSGGVVGTVDGWTGCTARVSVHCWPSRTDADMPRGVGEGDNKSEGVELVECCTPKCTET
jgi:hypothetical protein